MSSVPFAGMHWAGSDMAWKAGSAPAMVHNFDGKFAGGHAFGGGAHGLRGNGAVKLNASPQLKADFATLETDTKQLQSEIPSSLTTQLKADQAVIAKAMGTMSPSKPDGHAMFIATAASRPAGSFTTNVTSMLEKADVSSTQATQIASDFQTYQNDLKTVDPTLQSKIAADEAAIAKDGGPTLPTGGGGLVVNPGGPMMH